MLYSKSLQVLHLREELERIGKKLSKQHECKIQGFEIFTMSPNIGEYDIREWAHARKDSTCFPVQLTLTSIKNKEEIIRYLGAAADISEIKKVEKELKSLLALAED